MNRILLTLLLVCFGSGCTAPKNSALVSVETIIGDSIFESMDVRNGPILENAKVDVIIQKPARYQGYRMTIMRLRENAGLPENLFARGARLRFTIEQSLIIDAGVISETQMKGVELISETGAKGAEINPSNHSSR